MELELVVLLELEPVPVLELELVQEPELQDQELALEQPEQVAEELDQA